MPRSLAHGDYRLVMAIESSSRSDSWYRVLSDRQSGALSCDCPPWVFKQGGQTDDGARSCGHTRLAQLLAGSPPLTGAVPVPSLSTAQVATSLLIHATQQQWPGLGGQWSIEQRTAPVLGTSYHFVLLRLVMGNGGTATGLVAFTSRFHQDERSRIAGVAGWAGYAIAAEVARLGGFSLAGQPPEHYRVRSRGRAGRETPQSATQERLQLAPNVRIGLSDILRVGDQIDLGDGLLPAQRAENTLRLFLGEQLYQQLERQHFLDVSSVCYAGQERVYRLRRDPHKQRDRRVRVFEHGRYVNDFCIVRDQHVPEGDHWLTVFMQLLSDEQSALSVVKRGNVFPPHSDDYMGREEETTPAVWRPRVV